ncbi:Hypoticical protein [Pectobacterium parmentieri]|uniref:Hypoticical protein n=1 Tax=Pectobacterium parmentieri TaxID=1905730 RepID=A0A0H3I3I9_PECPM|nr:Hypoticical protein [Pectobacterium parmentieri]
MFYIVSEIWFHEKFGSNAQNINNGEIGRFLIIKHEEGKEVFLCDMAIVTKRSIDYYHDFTRLFVADSTLSHSLPIDGENISFKINKKQQEFYIHTSHIR